LSWAASMSVMAAGSRSARLIAGHAFVAYIFAAMPTQPSTSSRRSGPLDGRLQGLGEALVTAESPRMMKVTAVGHFC